MGGLKKLYTIALKCGIIYNIVMEKYEIVLDTNVVFSALNSIRGASYKLLSLLGKGQFITHLSVPLVLEYEEKLKEKRQLLKLTSADIDDVIDYMCSVGIKHDQVNIFWRPCLSDPDDEMILELAVHARVDYIVTHNIKDFKKIKGFRVKAITPRDFLKVLQEE